MEAISFREHGNDASGEAVSSHVPAAKVAKVIEPEHPTTDNPFLVQTEKKEESEMMSRMVVSGVPGADMPPKRAKQTQAIQRSPDFVLSKKKLDKKTAGKSPFAEMCARPPAKMDQSGEAAHESEEDSHPPALLLPTESPSIQLQSHTNQPVSLANANVHANANAIETNPKVEKPAPQPSPNFVDVVMNSPKSTFECCLENDRLNPASNTGCRCQIV
jgi:hypothetical protein